MNVVRLTKKLVSIPSYVDEKTNEKEICDFIYKYLKRIPNLKNVRRQRVEKDRFNVIANDGYAPRLLFAANMDTVVPKIGGKGNPLRAKIIKDKLYGLGAADLKGGLACVLNSVKNIRKTKGLMLVFYCDEEYYFKGMEKFLKEYRYSPELVVIPSSTNLKIGNSCRGVIEVQVAIKGETGHATEAKPEDNVIFGLVSILNKVEKELESKYVDERLRKPSFNLAYLKGGLMKKIDEKGKVIIGYQGSNNIPDIAEAVIDIRPTAPNLNADVIKKIFLEYLNKTSFKLLKFEIGFDLGPLYTPPKKLKKLETVLKENDLEVKYVSIKGYTDGQMIQDKWNSNVVCLGPKGKNAHSPNEYVTVDSLKKAEKIYTLLINEYCRLKNKKGE